MVKSGLIIGILAFFSGLGITLLLPLCVPCAAIFLGLAAGGLAGVFDMPLNTGAAAKTGALAGVIGGIGAILGQMIGAGVNAALVGPEQTQQLLRQFGMPVPSGVDYGAAYYFGAFGSACCIGLFNLLLMAGLGAVGGLLWWQIAGQKRTYNNSAIT
jgi:hypothetical protein